MAIQLKTATNDEVKSDIRRRLEKAVGEIRLNKVLVNQWESRAGDHEQRLGLLKKEGQFRISATVFVHIYLAKFG